ncbi:hypothetical protein [Paenibacillus macerans]|uniref:class I SAM-dependent methyltransferase n=1 Tax=Paenibacillus macerans TaxID=44252 RepID=UPI0020411232|nr:hypothetical protein [Paenibacillus macerans]MCM3701050.1 hypothetical protein [Paenibacillus macerans]
MKGFENKSFIFWGTSSLGKQILNHIFLLKLKINVDFFVDNDKSKEGKKIFDKLIVHSSEIQFLKKSNQLIIICSSFEKEISEQLDELGFQNSIDYISFRQFNDFTEYLIAKEKIDFNDELKVIIGAHDTYQPGWIATNESYLNLLIKDDWNALFGTKKINSILAEHVWEHLTFEEGAIAARHCFEQLKEGGKLRIAIPDGYHPDPYYIQWIKPNGYGHGSDDHKEIYNYKILEEILLKAGFTSINKLEYFDEFGNFHEKAWSIEDGFIKRSKKFDSRNWRGDIVYSSLIVDAVK